MTTETQRAVLLQQAYAFGFRLEYGNDLDSPNLLGKHWWSLSRDGWIDIEVSEGEWDHQEQAEDAIIVAHAEELMDPGLKLTAGDEFPEPHMEGG